MNHVCKMAGVAKMVDNVLLVVVLAGLLLLPARALAECAWVLWTGDINQLEDVVEAFASREECVSEQERTLNGWATSERVRRVGDVVAWLQKTKDGKERLIQIRYVCLPDTVDPRGRKGP